MSVKYIFVCNKCSTSKESEDLEVTLWERKMFVHDVSWEDFPEGWEMTLKGLYCNDCLKYLGEKVLEK